MNGPTPSPASTSYACLPSSASPATPARPAESSKRDVLELLQPLDAACRLLERPYSGEE